MKPSASKLELGDSQTVLQQFDASTFHLAITSPPYLNQREEYASYLDLNDYLDQMGLIFVEVYRVLRDGHIFAVNIGQDRSVDLPAEISRVLRSIGFQYIDTICWNKKGEIGTRGVFMEKQMYYPNFAWEPILIYRKPPLVTTTGKALSDEDFPQFEFSDVPFITSVLRSNVWEVIPEKGSWHPAPYPLQLAINLIRCYSKRGQWVLDPFGGSGTTAIAAEQTQRNWTLIERSPEYHAKALERINSSNLALPL